LLAALRALGHDDRRKVVILRPNLTKDEYDFARPNPQTAGGLRLRQLDSLVLGADGACPVLRGRHAITHP
jgi:hypothetical protein